MVFSSHLFVFYFLPAALGLYYLSGRWRLLMAAALAPAAVALHVIEPNGLLLTVLLCVVALLMVLRRRQRQHLMLTLLSYLFYGWANPAFVLLMAFSTAVDYIAGLAIAQRLALPVGWAWRRAGAQVGNGPRRWARTAGLTLRASRRVWATPIAALRSAGPRRRAQKLAVAASIVTNLGLLGFFKYFNLSVDSYNTLLAALGMEQAMWRQVINITLPLGISFYTFQSMSYTIDVYRGHARAMRHPVDFACYVSMFPQLVAGPIIRFQEVADQLRERSHTLEKFARGTALFAMGMAKKVMLANPCGKVADTCFEAGSVTVGDAWYGAFAYAMQIYFDFSGYSDMAIGLGLMLGFVFPKNFDSPYKSESITDFWRRWHISLSTWLRDYLYIPLGGNRLGPTRTYVNLMLVMLLGGLWHGAAWTFVIWGAIHGAWLAFERAQGKDSAYRRLPRPLRIGVTFLIVLIAWVFFRAASLDEAIRYLQAMLGLGDTQPGAGLIDGLIYDRYYIAVVTLAAIIAFLAPQAWDWTRRLTWSKAGTCAVLLWMAIAMLESQAYNPFIYFIF